MEAPSFDYQKDDTQEYLIELYQSDKIPPLVVALASPGTGKTTTISRIIQAIALKQSGEQKTNFLVLTFTRKTRFDLINKLKKMNGKYENKKYVRSRVKNFHSLAYDLVQWKTIIDKNTESARLSAFLKKQSLREGDQNALRKEIQRVINELMSQGCSSQEWNQVVQDLNNQKHFEVSAYLKEYKEWLDQQFNGKWSTTYNYSLIKSIEQIKKGSRHREANVDLDNLQLLIVDEFQDSNPAQLKMVEALIKRSKKDVKLLMVGDFDQNIYTWRGVDIAHIDQFIRSRQAKIVNLSNSYRLGPSLKNITQQLITSFPPYEFFRRRFYRNYELHARGKHDQELQVRTFKKEQMQVSWTVQKVREHMRKGVALGEMTILVRMTIGGFIRRLVQEIKEHNRRCKQQGEPQILYQIKFYNDVLKSHTVNYLFAIFNYFQKTQDEQLCREQIWTITDPLERVGEADHARNNMAAKGRISPQYVQYQNRQNYFEERKRSWALFFQDWTKIQKLVKECPKNGFLNVCKQIFKILGQAEWGDVKLQEDKMLQFYEVVEEVVESIDQSAIERRPVFSVFHELSLLADRKQNEQQYSNNDMLVQKRRNRLQIQTIHTSKGLQFEVVILNSLNYEFPDFGNNNRFSTENVKTRFDLKTRSRIDEQKEEVRVIYTGITRSARYCYVNSSIDFDRPNWLKKSDIKQHPQFKFLRRHGKVCSTQERERNEEESVERMMQRLNIN